MTLTDLLARCTEAKEGSRVLDAEIACYVRYHPYGPFHWLDKSPEAVYAPTHDGWMGFTLPGESHPRDAWASPEYTTSVDAILSLIEEKLPEWGWQIRKTGYAELNHPTHHLKDEVGYAATPELALVCAFLSAIAAALRTKDGA